MAVRLHSGLHFATALCASKAALISLLAAMIDPRHNLRIFAESRIDHRVERRVQIAWPGAAQLLNQDRLAQQFSDVV